MANKIDIPVVINGKVYTLSGYEGEDYLQNVATYINGKIAECKTSDQYRRMNTEYQGVLLALNIADDYFKAKNQIKEIEIESEEKNKELYNIKHELIAAQTKNDSLKKEFDITKEDLSNAQKQLIRLEAEIAELKKQLHKK